MAKLVDDPHWAGSRYVRRRRLDKDYQATDCPLRKIVGRIEKPYDTAMDGTLLMVEMDVLDCGHQKQTGKHLAGDWVEPPLALPNKHRRCRACKREGRE